MRFSGFFVKMRKRMGENDEYRFSIFQLSGSLSSDEKNS
jgi:hypothetical protein